LKLKFPARLVVCDMQSSRINRPPCSPKVYLASEHDDADLRRLLRSNPMPGRFALTLEREPSFFRASTIEGDTHQVITGRDRETGTLVGLGTRAVRDASVNGAVERVAYLSQLRVHPEYRGLVSWLKQGFQFLRQLHDQDDARHTFTTIIADNRLARTILEKDRRFKPNYRRCGELVTLLLPVWRRRSLVSPPGVSIRAGRTEHLHDIAACLQRNHRRRQFAPHWTADDLAHPERTRNLRPEDFLLAMSGPEIVGCAALWNQQSFKQTVVHGYDRGFSLFRRAMNIGARVTGWPRFPAVGEPLSHAYVSHLAIDDDRPEICCALIQAALNRSVASGYVYLVLGLHGCNPLLPSVKSRFYSIDLRSILYHVFWPEGQSLANSLDDRVPHIEVAVI
jgi:ribosomal protein S18 acetylase RimI-like enzyme